MIVNYYKQNSVGSDKGKISINENNPTKITMIVGRKMKKSQLIQVAFLKHTKQIGIGYIDINQLFHIAHNKHFNTTFKQKYFK